MAATANDWSARNGDEQAPTAGVGRRVRLPGGVRVALGGGPGEGVVVAVGARSRVTEHPTQCRPVVGTGEHATVEGRRQVMTSDLIDALRLPLPVCGTQAVGRVAAVG